MDKLSVVQSIFFFLFHTPGYNNIILYQTMLNWEKCLIPRDFRCFVLSSCALIYIMCFMWFCSSPVSAPVLSLVFPDCVHAFCVNPAITLSAITIYPAITIYYTMLFVVSVQNLLALSIQLNPRSVFLVCMFCLFHDFDHYPFCLILVKDILYPLMLPACSLTFIMNHDHVYQISPNIYCGEWYTLASCLSLMHITERSISVVKCFGCLQLTFPTF